MKKRHSIAIFPLNMGGSNACRLELDAIFNPPYNAARYGITLTTSPKQADMILLFGTATIKTATAIQRLLAGLPQEVKLVALGSEAASATPFKKAYAITGSLIEADKDVSTSNSTSSSLIPDLDRILPEGRHIAAFIAGSPPDPQTIVDGILQADLF